MKKLVSSRITPPVLKKNSITRAGLIRKIEGGFDKKVLVLEAGAGHGKTSSLRQALTSLKESQWCWLSLANESNDSTTFWSYILETTSSFLAGEKDAAYDYFQQCLQAGSFTDFGLFLVELLPQDQEIYLILDDFHFVTDKQIADSLDVFIAALPMNLHLVLITRYKPAVYLGQLMLEQDLQYLTEKDFLLSDLEANELITLNGFGSLSLEIRQELVIKANGWLGGLQLLLLSSDFSNQQRGNQAKRIVSDYLAKEILDNLPKKERNFLIHTAYYPFVFSELSQAVFPDIVYSEMLKRLQEQNLMLTVLSGEKERFTYHPLLREAFVETFMQQPQSEINAQLTVGAAVFREAGYLDECLSLLLELKDYSKIMEIIVNQPQNLRTTFYIQQVPDEIATKNIDFAFQKLFYYYIRLDYKKLEELIAELERSYPDLQEIGAFDGMRLLLGSDFEQMQRIVLSKEEILALPLNNVSKAFLYLKGAMILYYANDFRKALEYVYESRVLNRNSGDFFINYMSQTFLAQIYEEIGDFKQSLHLLFGTYDELGHYSNGGKETANYHLSFDLTIAGVYLKKMALAEAEASLAKLTRQKHPHMRASYLYNYAVLLYLKDETEAALEVVRQLFSTDYYQNPRTNSGLLRYMLKSDQLSVEKQEDLIGDYKKEKQLSISNTLFYGMLLSAGNQNEKARGITDDLLEICRKERIYLRIIGADLLKIELLLKEQAINKRVLCNLYHEAIHYGNEYEILSEFFIYRKELSCLIKEMGNELLENLNTEERLFHQKILKLLQLGKVQILSHREMDVLNELALGLTNKEISAKLYISVATTKTHILNIYRKLEVNSRVQAIEEARRLGILNE